jgi:hypothetical protein
VPGAAEVEAAAAAAGAVAAGPWSLLCRRPKGTDSRCLVSPRAPRGMSFLRCSVVSTPAMHISGEVIRGAPLSVALQCDLQCDCLELSRARHADRREPRLCRSPLGAADATGSEGRDRGGVAQWRLEASCGGAHRRQCSARGRSRGRGRWARWGSRRRGRKGTGARKLGQRRSAPEYATASGGDRLHVSPQGLRLRPARRDDSRGATGGVSWLQCSERCVDGVLARSSSAPSRAQGPPHR